MYEQHLDREFLKIEIAERDKAIRLLGYTLVLSAPFWVVIGYAIGA